jgi:hypothetical protein
MAYQKKRITFEDATKLYPDEWVLFIEPRIDQTTTTFIDGVAHFHSKDQEQTFLKAKEASGPIAIRFTAEVRYRKSRSSAFRMPATSQPEYPHDWYEGVLHEWARLTHESRWDVPPVGSGTQKLRNEDTFRAREVLPWPGRDGEARRGLL